MITVTNKTLQKYITILFLESSSLIFDVLVTHSFKASKTLLDVLSMLDLGHVPLLADCS